MEYILSIEEMRRADSLAIEKLKIPGLILMENAGLKTAQCISGKFNLAANRTVAIVCGKGNNGGDGFVIGRHLSRMGVKVTFWLAGKKQDLGGDAEINMKIADKMGLKIHELKEWDSATNFAESDLLIDALLGTGLKGETGGIYAKIIEGINNFTGTVIAVDTPSGLDCDTGNPLGVCVKADMTVTMGNIKTGMLFYPGRSFTGELFIADLNVTDRIFDQINPGKYIYCLADYANLLPFRPETAYKNSFGNVLVLAGSTGLTGAARLSCQAALRSGAGMVILGCPNSLNSVFEISLTEVMTRPLPDTTSGCLRETAFDALQDSLEWSSVIALGPGLSTNPETEKFVHRMLKEQSRRMVIDADGLNNLASNTGLLKNYSNDLVLTPHIGELSRLTGMKIPEIKDNSIKTVQKFAEEWGVVLLLKGSPTLIGDPEGNVYINLSGNAGMATAGSGDVLTGLIAGFLGQGLSSKNAAILAAFVHGLAGDRLEQQSGQRGMIAGDLVDQIPDTLDELAKVESGASLNYYKNFVKRLF